MPTPEERANFIASFSAQLEAEPAAVETQPTDETITPDAEGSADDEADSDDLADGQGTEPGNDADSDDASDDEGDDTDGGDEPDEDAPDEDAGDDEGDDEGEDSDEPHEVDQSFEDAAERHRLPTQFEDVLKTIADPAARKAARAAFETRLGQMEAGFTKAQQEATTFRRERAAWEAEQAWRTENAVPAIVSQLRQNPALLDEIYAELDKLAEDPKYALTIDKVVEDGVKGARKQVEDGFADQDHRQQRAVAVSRFMDTAAKKAGVPLDATGIPEAIALHVATTGDISNEEIEKIVAEKAKVWKHRTGYVKRDAVRAKNKARVEAVKKGPKIKPGQGNAIVPTKPKGAEDTRPLREKMMDSVNGMFPGR